MDATVMVRVVEECTVVEVAGQIDLYSVPRLRDALLETIESGTRELVVDLDMVEFIDSSGLGVLVGALKRLRAVGGALHLICSRPLILKVFAITGLMRVFPIHATLADAVAGVRASG